VTHNDMFIKKIPYWDPD